VAIGVVLVDRWSGGDRRIPAVRRRRVTLRRLTPRQLGAVTSPDGHWLVVSNDGQGAQSLQVINTTTSKVTQTLTYPSPTALFVGLTFTRDGKTLYASGGGNNLIRRYTVNNGTPYPIQRAPTPRAHTADNDWALDQLVDAVSHSQYWPNTASSTLTHSDCAVAEAS
jgi:DNA-binding beta-propeller fold protein YncE